MAIRDASKPNVNGTLDFFADTEEDIVKLPTGDAYYRSMQLVGSTCLVISTSEVYIYTPSFTWVKL